MKKNKQNILLSLINQQLLALEEIKAEIIKIDPIDKSSCVNISYNFHNLYCGLEDIFKLIAKNFENNIEDPSQYHKELLDRMTISVASIRPSVISKASYPLVNDLRGFRHVFRHSYQSQLRSERLVILKQDLLKGWKIIEKDLKKFCSFLK